MIIGNITLFSKNPIKFMGGTSLSSERSNFNTSGRNRNIYSQWSATASEISKSSVPNGYIHPYSWVMAQSSGGMALYKNINGIGSANANLAGGMGASSSIYGIGEISSAGLGLILQAVSIILSSGSLSASIIGNLNSSATLAGSGNFSGALGALADAVSEITGSGEFSSSINSHANMEAEITPFTDLSPQGIASAVWNSLASNFNNSLTMGNKLNASGSAGDPWSTELPGVYAAGTAGDMLGNMNILLPDAIWDEIKSGHTSSNTYGKIIQDLESLAKQIKSLSAANL